MTGISVIRKAGAVARRILTNEYDASGRVIAKRSPMGAWYEIKYGPLAGEHATSVRLTEPSGRILHLRLYESSYEARTDVVKYPASESKP